MAAENRRAKKSLRATAGARCLAWSVAPMELGASSLTAGDFSAAVGFCGAELVVGGDGVGWSNRAGSAVAEVVAVAASLHQQSVESVRQGKQGGGKRISRTSAVS